MSASELARALQVARRAAAEAGELLMSGVDATITVENKGAIDLVTDYDRRSEELVVGTLEEAFPEHQVVAEEGGGTPREGEGIPRWYVDPLDGTTNFAHRLPFFAVSIALEVDGILQVGVVRAPALGWEFWSRRGAGAWLNQKGEGDRRLRVSDTPRLREALVATGFPYDRATSSDNNLHRVSRVLPRSQGLRRVGSAALDCAMVAWGRMDAYWEVKINAWDVAAGALLVQEAGGRVSGFEGGPLDLTERRILCSNGRIHQRMVDLLQGS